MLEARVECLRGKFFKIGGGTGSGELVNLFLQFGPLRQFVQPLLEERQLQDFEWQYVLLVGVHLQQRFGGLVLFELSEETDW